MFKKLSVFALYALVLLSACHRDKNTSSSGDYFPVKEYTLKNGLKVFISVNKKEPRIQTAITVKAGSKYDPPQTTGLAHYLEHMLFKGSKQFGTVDYEKEKPYLDVIAALYEQRYNEKDPEKKKAIYKQIDSISYEASKLAIPNEYDKMVASIGAKGTNAFTSRDLTCYINDIPSTALEKWLSMESDRFQNLTLRIFHTELEAVYEEFNIATAYDQEWSYQAVDSLLMPNHPYGTQTTIGESEHLKNPSLKNIQDYFDTYYVPNNTAIVLSGDLDPEKTLALIEKHFGSWQAKEIPQFVKEKPVEITQPLYTEKFGHEPEHVYVGYRMNGADSEDPLYAQLIDAILANGKGSGLIDLNLLLQQKVLDAYSFVSDDKDYTVLKLYGEPKEGQTLDDVKKLLVAQIDSIKQGNFPDWLLEAVIANKKYEMIKLAESNAGRTFDIVHAFVKDVSIDQKRKEIAALSKITKADIVQFANERFADNYAVCYKRNGEPNLFKVEKPQITPVVLNKDSVSAFKKQFDATEEATLEPRFNDFEKEIKHTELSNGVRLDYVRNEVNKTFSLNYIFDFGTDNDSLLGLAIDYLPFLGTDKYSAAKLKQEFYKYALNFSVYSSRDRVYISLSGLEENLEKGVTLFEHLLANVQPNQEVYNDFAQDIIKKRADAKLEKSRILWGGLYNYAQYGEKNPFNSVISNDVLTTIDAQTLTEKIQTLSRYKHSVFYYGQNSIVQTKETLNKLHKTNGQLADYPAAKKYPELPTDKATVYFAHYPMKQAELILLSKKGTYNKADEAKIALFNEYYGEGMASVIFQEVREKAALAYAAYGGFRKPDKKEQSNYVFGYVGTQADKLPQAVDKLSDLLNNLEKSDQSLALSKQAITKKLESEWIIGVSIYWRYLNARKLGLDYDIRKDIYAEIPNLQFDDIQQFFDKNVKGKSYVYVVVGDKSEVNLKSLQKLGEVKEVRLDKLFGY